MVSVGVMANKSRLNGWSCPPHPFQFIAWAFFLYFGLFFILTTAPELLTQWQPAGYIVFGVFFVIHLVVHLLAVSINPADPNVLAKMKEGPQKMPIFDRASHKHVIENQHCYLCDVDVGPKSKHCSACNKCVSTFDHHCKWLNNCVGGRNYRLFIATLITAICGCLVVVIVCLVQFIAFYTDADTGNILKPYNDHLSTNATIVFKLFYSPVSDNAWLGLTMVTAVLALLGVGLLFHLLGFHIYLMCKGLTTYDYIVLEREKSEAAARAKEIEEGKMDGSKHKGHKSNRIAPDTVRSSMQSGYEATEVAEDAHTPTPTPPPPLSPSVTIGRVPSTRVPSSRGPAPRKVKKKKSQKRELPLAPNGALKMSQLGDTRDLTEAINRKQSNSRGVGEVLDSDHDGFGPSSITDVGVAVRKRSSTLDSGIITPDTDLSGTDSEREDGEEGAHPPPPGVERLQLPPDSEDEGERNSDSATTMASTPQGITPRLYTTLPEVAIRPAPGAVAYHHHPYNSDDSGESLNEIPVSSTRYGGGTAGSSHVHQASVHTAAEEQLSVHADRVPTDHPHEPIDAFTVGKKKTRKKKKDKSKHLNKLRSLQRGELDNGNGHVNFSAHYEEIDAVRFSNQPKAHPEGAASPIPTRVNRHKDVPPLDLSSLNSSDDEITTHRKKTSKSKSQSSQI